MNTYVFDQGWQKERDRLAGIEFLFDSYSTQRLAGLGVREGWHCLEVGCGAGGVALWLAGQVGSTGRVLAADLDPRFLDGHGRANLEVRKHDIAAGPLEEAAFDLAHARAGGAWPMIWFTSKETRLRAAWNMCGMMVRRGLSRRGSRPGPGLLADELGIQLLRVGSGNRMTFLEGEQALSAWMAENAYVSWVVRDRPWELQDELITALDMPLNLQGTRTTSSTPY